MAVPIKANASQFAVTVALPWTCTNPYLFPTSEVYACIPPPMFPVAFAVEQPNSLHEECSAWESFVAEDLFDWVVAQNLLVRPALVVLLVNLISWIYHKCAGTPPICLLDSHHKVAMTWGFNDKEDVFDYRDGSVGKRKKIRKRSLISRPHPSRPRRCHHQDSSEAFTKPTAVQMV
ncbi:hypothetical protein BV898_10999 [Hypsibius exemplaris]|uniref:Uncharacterized protein n=1 Tax=Hypsibius exemplaris TaxID=2072580 RepID=A0A1W0WI54_HYPEX|nr:hypothetical protein BV898_10999 [Hypsibius exemplaris]